MVPDIPAAIAEVVTCLPQSRGMHTHAAQLELTSSSDLKHAPVHCL